VNTHFHRRGRPAARPTAIASAVFVLAAGAAQAQETQTIVVTGIRAAIESSIATKKSADTIVEAINSEDLGKLPEPSVADAMARLPGVAAQRNKGSGKAQSISVRGMSPDFNAGLLNGREVASSGNSRGVDFDLYPAELLNSVLVYKTPHAGLMGQGLSSTIDLRTIRPLNSKDRQIALNYRELKTGIDNGVPNGEGSGDRMSFSYVDQFLDRTLGVGLGAVKFKEKGAAQLRVNTWGGWTPYLDTATPKGDCGATPRPATCAGVPGGFGRDVEFSDQEREGLMGVLQWKPNKNFETVLDIFQSKGRQANFKKGIEGFIGGGSDGHNYRTSPPNLVSAVVDANGIATSGTIDNFKGVIRNHNEGVDDKANAWGLNSKLKLADWTLAADLASSEVKKQSARYETTAGLPGNGNINHSRGVPVTPGATGTISWTGFTGSNHGDLQFTSSTDFGDRSVVKLTDVMGWGGGTVTQQQAGYVAAPKLNDKIDNLRLSAMRDLTWAPLSRVEFGVNQVNRTKKASTEEGFLVIAGGSANQFAAADIPGSSTLVVDGIEIATWDPRGSLGSIYELRPNTYGTVINRNWSVKEDVSTGFAKFDVDTELFGKGVSGNIGAQIIRTKQRSTGFVNDAGQCTGSTPDTCTSQSGGTTFTDVLPSLNLAMELTSDTVARLGLGKTLSRPRMNDMRASIDAPSISTPTDGSGTIFTAGAGNPELEPFRATAVDISVEKYFGGNKGYVSLAGFYKDIQTYVLTLPRAFDFQPVLAPGAAIPDAGTVGILTRPTNGSGGYIRGIELTVNVPFSLLTPVLDGFGISVNHSDTTSSITILPSQLAGLDVGGALRIPLPGLSRKVTNTRLYYEKYGIQVSVAARTRSDFLGENIDYKDDAQITFIRGETVVDLQVGYTFPDTSFLKGLSLLFQGNNMTDALFRQYQTDRNNPTETKRYGKTYLFGANYKF
jgi:iron complex outermembrane recepter protein